MTMTKEEFENLRKGLIEVNSHYDSEDNSFAIDLYAADGGFCIDKNGYTYYYEDIVTAIKMFNLMNVILNGYSFKGE